MESETSSLGSAAMSVSKPLNKLGAVGAAILEEYWSKHASPTLPPLSDRKELTKRVKQLPGYDYWNDSKTSDWFRRRCKKLQQTSNTPQSQVMGTSGPTTQIQNAASLNDTIQLLGVLLKDQPNPTSDVVNTWATLLSRNAGDAVTVETWVALLQQLIKVKSVATPDILTKSADTIQPDSSTDPVSSGEGSLAAVSNKMKHDPANSPVLPPVSVAIQGRPEASEPQSRAGSIPQSTSSTSTSIVSQSNHPTTFQAIVGDVLEALPASGALDCSPLPTNSDEFEAMFAPYRQKLTRLLHFFEPEL